MRTWTRRMLPLLAIGLFTVAGCSEPEPVGIPHAHDASAEAEICGLCGNEKAHDHVCPEGAENCPKCGKDKGSILCCSTAIHGVRDVHLCRKCGEVGFTDKCCKDAPKCEKCGMHKGSPGCCKIEPYTAGTDDAGDDGGGQS